MDHFLWIDERVAFTASKWDIKGEGIGPRGGASGTTFCCKAVSVHLCNVSLAFSSCML